MLRLKRPTAIASVMLSLLVLSRSPGAALAQATTPAATPFSTVLGSAPNHGGTTIPYFADAFTYQGVSYPYTMVGTNPKTSTATTVVPTTIVPLRFVFADGTVLDGTDAVAATVASPVFRKAAFLSGTTQYGDAIQRAMFWRYVAGTDYHVLLEQPRVLPAVTIVVPPTYGSVARAGDVLGYPAGQVGHALGLVDATWFFSRYPGLVASTGVGATWLPILLSHNIGLYLGSPSGPCCVLGFHSVDPSGPLNGSGNQQVQTSVYASYDDPGAYLRFPGIQDVHALSHEVAEWLSDPFGTNPSPAWFSPLAPWYGCSRQLEVGDPLVGVAFVQDGYHLQDEAFLSWFAREVPSTGILGRYTYLGTFAEPAPAC